PSSRRSTQGPVVSPSEERNGSSCFLKRSRYSLRNAVEGRVRSWSWSSMLISSRHVCCLLRQRERTRDFYPREVGPVNPPFTFCHRLLPRQDCCRLVCVMNEEIKRLLSVLRTA